MNKIYKYFCLLITLINFLSLTYQFNLQKESLTDETIHNIDEEVKNAPEYKKAEFESKSTDINHFFKYQNTSIPSSRVSAFRIEFDVFNEVEINKYKIYCTSIESSKTDLELIDRLKYITNTNTSCVGGFNPLGFYDGIIEHDEAKMKVGIIVASEVDFEYTGRVFFRTEERLLGTSEERPIDAETYSLIPYTIIISKFRELSKSKILFYSYTRELQMYYVETNSPYPEKLFSGNIMSVFTNPNMVRQKYHGANVMILLTNKFGSYEMVGEPFKYEVKLFDSNFLLDYYVSSNEEGRPIKSPLLINMTECTDPYYVILNYNQMETSKTLIIDQIYGKLASLSVATTFTKTTWEEMLENDMVEIDINSKKFVLPSNSRPHMDVYKIECKLPLMFNFYYVEDDILIEKMNYGDINLFTLKPFETINVPFFLNINPQVIIEIFNPVNDPIVIVEAQESNVYQKNTLIKIIPLSLANGITIKERGGFSDTRIIIKVGYPNNGWEDKSQYIKYYKEYEIYLF